MLPYFINNLKIKILNFLITLNFVINYVIVLTDVESVFDGTEDFIFHHLI